MRNLNNLKKFPHTGKSPDQKNQYAKMLSGEQMRGTTLDYGAKKDFGDTVKTGGIVVEGEELRPKHNDNPTPHRSLRTKVEDNKFGILLGIVIPAFLALSGWLLYTTNTTSTQVQIQTGQIEGNIKDIEYHTQKIDSLEDRTIENTVNIENLKDDVGSLKTDSVSAQSN
jgi:hypothetical protein